MTKNKMTDAERIIGMLLVLCLLLLIVLTFFVSKAVSLRDSVCLYECQTCQELKDEK